MIHNELALAAGGSKAGMLDLLIKSHWYKCSVTLDGAHLGITLDDDIDMITSQGDTDITIPRWIVSSHYCVTNHHHQRRAARAEGGGGQQVWRGGRPRHLHQGRRGEQDAHPHLQGSRDLM